MPSSRSSTATAPAPPGGLLLQTAWWLLLPALLLCTGCEKVPTFKELIGQETAEPEPEPLPQRSAEPTELTTREEPVQPVTPAAISAFQSASPLERDDRHLLALADVEEGLEVFEEVNLGGSRVSAAGVAVLQKFPALRTLQLGRVQKYSPEMAQHIGQIETLTVLTLEGNGVTDSDLIPIGQLRNLVELNLSNTQVTDEGLEHLKDIETLEVLRLSHTNINGSGFRHFRRRGVQNRIRVIDVSHTSFSQQGFPHIRNWQSLEEFSAGQSGVYDLCMAALGTCKNLTYLSLGFNPQITDAGMNRLGSLRKLETLDLRSCSNVSDRGLYFIRNNKNLQLVGADGTRVTRNGALGLKKFAPDVRVSFPGGAVD